MLESNTLYHIYTDGFRITSEPWTMIEIERVFGKRETLKRKGYILVEFTP